MKYITGLLAIAVAGVLAVSCIKDSNGPGIIPPGGEGKVKMELYAVPDDFTFPRTRAAEGQFDMAPMVIVFQGTDDSAVFVEAVEAVSSGAYSTVELSPNPNPVVLLLLSNPPGDVLSGGTLPVTVSDITTAFTGKTLRELEESGAFQTRVLGSSPLNTLPFSGSSDVLPMSAVVKLPRIQEGDSIGDENNKISLKRAVAKVTVQVDSSIAADFQLVSVGVARASASGSIYYEEGELSTAILGTLNYGNGSTGMAMAVNNTTANNPIYLYESVYQRNKTILIAKAVIGGQIKYTRMAFYDDGAYLDIERNKHYVFTIIGVGVTYDTFEAAVQSTAPGNGGGYNTGFWDYYSYDIVNNSNYSLLMGVTSSTIDLFTDKEVNAKISVACYSNESGVTSIDVTTSGGIVVGTTTISTPGIESFNITVPAGVTEGQVTLRLGVLVKVIDIVRHSDRMTGGVLEMHHSDYIRAERGVIYYDWLLISYDGTNTTTSFTRDMPGSLYIHALPSAPSGTVTTVVAARQYAGRSTIYFEVP